MAITYKSKVDENHWHIWHSNVNGDELLHTFPTEEEADYYLKTGKKLTSKAMVENWEEQFNAWVLKYEVMSNPFAGGIEDKFETYGEELDYVLKIAYTEPKRIWTLVEGDDGNLYITSGYHLVNRIYYFITHNPCELEYEEYPYFIYEETV